MYIKEITLKVIIQTCFLHKFTLMLIFYVVEERN